MGIGRTGRVVHALLALMIAVGRPALAAPVVALPAHSPAPAGCSATVDCGPGCSATFTTGFCVVALEWQGGLSVGPLQIGPSLSAECSICECWYIYTSANGYEVFKRVTTLRCSAELPGVDLHVV